MCQCYSKLVTLYKLGEVYFRLLGTNFLLQARVVVRTSNMKISRRHLAEYVKKMKQKACRTFSTIIFPLSINEIVDLWRCCSGCLRHFLNSLLKLDSVTQRINHYPLDKYYQNTISCPIGSAIHPGRWLAKVMLQPRSQDFSPPRRGRAVKKVRPWKTETLRPITVLNINYDPPKIR